MDDPVRPSEDDFNRVLLESCNLWSSYLDGDGSNPALPSHCVELKHILAGTPHFLAYDVLSGDDSLSFDCFERGTALGPCDLFVKGKSTWKTTKGLCDLGPKTMNHKLLLATQTTLKVEFSEETALSNWPGVQGLDGHDHGNYISVILLACAYILSAKWAELLQHSSDHNCAIEYVSGPILSEPPRKLGMDIGGDFNDEEGRWWNAILTGDKGWKISMHYKDKEYLSPWSISTIDGACVQGREESRTEIGQPPSSEVALKYLSKFCGHHKLYGQCSAALASALYIPLLSGRRISLPMPKPVLEKAN